jgi:hypothetical protein
MLESRSLRLCLYAVQALHRRQKLGDHVLFAAHRLHAVMRAKLLCLGCMVHASPQ